MRKLLFTVALALAFSAASEAAEIQGVIADWNCVQGMVKNGREKTLLQNRGCSLMKDYKRKAYGLITDDKKFYRLSDPGDQHVLQILHDSSDRDNLRVLVRGDLQGNTITIQNMTLL